LDESAYEARKVCTSSIPSLASSTTASPFTRRGATFRWLVRPPFSSRACPTSQGPRSPLRPAAHAARRRHARLER
jgi:hypothetical protein